ncbi:MAG TPA: glycogen debranching N-terminal domain-containing protein [Actinomycetota bacterium]|nr:glycogen debranching N-terminal domain-containing protein [Actinomycetota bacterium]
MPEAGFAGGDEVAVLEGSTFMLSDRRGDVDEGTVAGFYAGDTRFLSRFVLTIDGERPQLLTSNQVDYYTAAFFLTNAERNDLPERSISIQRSRFVGRGLHDDLGLVNHLDRPVQLEVRFDVGADFADLFEVKADDVHKRGSFRREHDDRKDWLLRFLYEHEGFEAATIVSFSQQPSFDRDVATFVVELGPRGTWEMCIEVSPHRGGELDLGPVHGHGALGETEREARQIVEKWRDGVPVLETDWDDLAHSYRRSVVDLAALRLVADVEGNEYSLPAAGLPWFMAIFGRDTLVVSYQSLLVGPSLAEGALRALAALQGNESDDFRDEDPGKILHEIRYGELTVLGETPHRPYYGSVDSTMLFLILLDEHRRLTGDDALARELEPNARAALRWIDEHGDVDGDGYVEYATRSSRGLRNQGWKDSTAAIGFANGKLAEPPIALCEVQAYAYDAKVRMAAIAQEVWDDASLAEKLRTAAAELKERFDRDFWIEERGHHALALDADKRQVDALTSNIGRLLWSGIVGEDRARSIVERLFSDELWSGWGIRTMSSADAGYNPIGYHVGTVWPHDNSLIASGLARYGYREEANRIAVALFEASRFTEHRLPEVFAGYPRADSRFPVRYPTASSPQAWATGAPFLFLRTMLGLDVRNGEPHLDPMLPEAAGRIAFRGVHMLGRTWDVEATTDGGEVRPAG